MIKVQLFIIVLTSILFSINTHAAIKNPDAGTASCYKNFNMKTDPSWAVVWRKTWSEKGKTYTSGPYKGSLNFNQSGKTGIMLWTGYRSRFDSGFFNTGRDISNTMFSPNFPSPNNELKEGWEYNVLAIFRTNNNSNLPYWVDNKEYYGAFSPGMDLRYDIYLDFNDDLILPTPNYYKPGKYFTEKSSSENTKNTNPDNNNAEVTWQYLGTHFIKDPGGRWNLWSFPEDDSKNDCNYPKKYWPPLASTDHYSQAPPKELMLAMSPTTSYALACPGDNEGLVFNINTGLMDRVRVDLEDFEFFDVEVVDNQGSGSYPNFMSSEEGNLKLKVTLKEGAQPEVGDELTLTATLASSPSKTSSSTILYVPYRLALDSSWEGQLYGFAGQPIEARVTAKACQAGSATTINYSSQELNISYDFVRPNLGTANISYAPKIEVGRSYNNSLKVDNSGEFNVFLEDDNFDCSKYDLDYCPFESGDKLRGVFTVYARPWTFAICDKNGNNLVKDKIPFAKSGELFDVLVKPIAWQEGVDPYFDYEFDEHPYYPEGFDVQNICDRAALSNFFYDDALPVTVKLTTDPSTPYPSKPYPNSSYPESPSETNHLTGQLEKLNTDALPDKSGLLFDNLTFESAGSIFLVVDPINYPYSTTNTRRSYSELGIFFPYKLALNQDASIQYYGTSSGASLKNELKMTSFNYMDAVSSINLAVEARSKNGTVIKEFSLFKEEHKPKLSLVVLNRNTGEDLTERWEHLGSEKKSLINAPFGQWKINGLNRFKRKLEYSSKNISDRSYGVNKVYSPDGPYNSDNTIFGVVSDGGVTDLHFMEDPSKMINAFGVSNGIKFPFPLDFRYGRMILSTTYAPAGKAAHIPLRIEYWDGEKFILNAEDNDTKYAYDDSLNWGDVYGLDKNYCFANNQTDGKINGYYLDDIKGVMSVKNGQGTIIAHQDVARKASVMFTLMLGEDKNQYCKETSYMGLKHLLNDKTDPSALLYFGHYRGGDRVLYRSEPKS